MRFNLPVLVAAAFILAACSTASDQGSGSGGAGSAATPGGPKPGSQMDLEINVGDRVFFDFDRSNLKPEARTTIERWAAWLKTYPGNKAIIEGHADERGTREYNLALGERRANSAREYLVSLGVDPNRVKIISYGKERPAVPGSNERAWSQNRRAVVILDN